MAKIKAKKKPSTKREEFKLTSFPEIQEQFGLSNMKGSLLKYNENIRTAKDIRFRDNGRLQIPVFAVDPAVCVIGEEALIGGTLKICSAANTWTATGGAVAGSDTQVQFNDGGVLAGDADLTWNKTTNVMTLAAGSSILTGSIDNVGENDLFLNGNAPQSTGTGGEVQIFGQRAATGSTGGAVELRAGRGLTGGRVFLDGGTGENGGDGGDILLFSGEASGTNCNAGNIRLLLPRGNGSGTDAVFTVRDQNNVVFLSIDPNTTINGIAITQIGIHTFRVAHTITTTDAVATNANANLMPTMTNDSMLYIQARVAARRTGGTSGTNGDSAGYVRKATFKKIGAAAPVLVGAILADYTAEDQAAWDATFVVSGNQIFLQVTGAADNNVTWDYEVYHILNT